MFYFAHAGHDHAVDQAIEQQSNHGSLTLTIGIICFVIALAIAVRYVSTGSKAPKSKSPRK